MKCTKVCEAGAITVEGSLAHIDYDKCTAAGNVKKNVPERLLSNPGRQRVIKI